MHQYLKSTYSLSQPFSNDTEGWQTLLANQAYGTFFTINGRFTFEKGTHNPTSCDLYLQNYQGNVTIGIVSIEKTLEVCRDTFFDHPTLVLIVHLKALHTKIKESQNLEIKPKNVFNVTEFSPKLNLKVEIIFDTVEGFSTSAHQKKSPGYERFPFVDQVRALREGDDLVIPNYNERVDINVIEYYKNYYSKRLNIDSDLIFSIEEYNDKEIRNKEDVFIDFDLKTVNGGGYIKIDDIYDIVTIKDYLGDIILSEKVIKPYPCSHNYVRFVN